MKEQSLERRLIREVGKLGGLTVKNAFAGVKSLPDRSVYLPGGVCLFVEMKAPGKQATEKQKLAAAKFELLGFQYFVIDSVESLNAFIKVAKFYA